MTKPKIKLTLEQAAKEFLTPKSTLLRSLRALDFPTGRGAAYTLAEIFKALAGDLNFERTRETRARADLLEYERREKERDLVSLAEVQTLIRDAFLPVRQRLMALPNEMANRTNPTDPQFAREALLRWVDESLPMIRDGLPKPKKEKTK